MKSILIALCLLVSSPSFAVLLEGAAPKDGSTVFIEKNDLYKTASRMLLEKKFVVVTQKNRADYLAKVEIVGRYVVVSVMTLNTKTILCTLKEMSQETVNSTIKQMEASEQNQELGLLQKYCAGGDGDSCLSIGLRLGHSKSKESVNYFEKACNYGNSGGCMIMYNNYREGIDVVKDETKAEYYLEKAWVIRNKSKK